MSVRFAPEAVADLAATLEYISERNPAAARRLADRVLDVIHHIASGDFDGPEQVLSSGEIVRSWPVHPLRFYYQRSGADLEVLRVYHHARQPITE